MTFTLKNIVNWLSAQNQELLIEKRIFHIASFLMLLGYGATFCANLILNTSLNLQVGVFVSLLVYATLFYFSRFKHQYYLLVFIIYTLISLSLFWISYGGLEGGMFLIYSLVTILFLITTPSKRHILTVFGVLINIFLLYSIQNSEWLTGIFGDKLNLSFLQTLIFSSIILVYGFVINSIKKLYDKIEKKINLKNQELTSVHKEVKLLLNQAIVKNSKFEEIQRQALQNMEQLTKVNEHLEHTREELESTIKIEHQTKLTLNKQNNILKSQRLALDKSTILLTINSNGIFTYVNQNFCTLSGYQAKDLEGKSYIKILHPDIPATFVAIMSRQIEQKEKWSGTIKSKTKDGDPFWLKSIIVPIFAAENVLSYYMMIATDVSNETILQEKERSQRILYKILDVSINEAPVKEILNLCLEELFAISWLKVRKKGGIFLTGGSPYLKKIVHNELEEYPSIMEIADTTTPIGLAAYFQEVIFVDKDADGKISKNQHFIVPIIWADDLLGILILYITHKQVTKDIKIELLKSVAATLGGVLKRKQAEDGLKTYSKKLEIYNKEILKSNEFAEMQNRKILDSIRYAKRIQVSMLLEKTKIINHYKDCFIFFEPRDIVSGDFYWFAEKGNQKILVAADCTGHGVPGAFMTIMGNLFLDEIVKTYGITSPEDILSILDMKISAVFGADGTKDGMDIAIIVTDNDAKKLYFSGAKNPLYYVRNNEIHVVKGSRLSVGGSKPNEEKDFGYFDMDIEENDVFYIFSDGFQDQFSSGQYGTKYLRKRFREFLFKIHQLPFKQQEEDLNQEFLNWKGDYKQTDDILVIGVRP